jgi:hypothetical protein
MLAWILADVFMAPTLTRSGCLIFTINSKDNSTQVFIYWSIAAIPLSEDQKRTGAQFVPMELWG